VARLQPISVRTDAAANRWDAFVGRQPSASIYHQSVWTTIVERAFGHETCRLAAECEGEIVGVLPLVFFNSWLFGRFAVSMPFFNYGGLLAASPEVRHALLDAAVAETEQRGGSYVELRHTTHLLPELLSKTHKVAMVLPLAESVDMQWQCIDRKLRNQVRKAEKSGVSVTQGGAELVDAFYQVFARNMRDLGTPVYSKRLFSEVTQRLPESTRIFCATVGGQPVAAALVVWHGNRIEVPWASSLREFNPLCANVLVYWEMLRFAIERRMSHFDFGRSTPNEGTFYFKRQWGAEPHSLVWEYWLAPECSLPDLSPKNPRFSLATSTWRKLPVSLTRLVGPALVRNIP
jgi:FemAB-related protein (PEP-CTERM system-associated)